MSLQLTPQLKMQLHLSQRLQQAARLLEMSAQDVQQLIEQSQDNPCIEQAEAPEPLQVDHLTHKHAHADISEWQDRVTAPTPRYHQLYSNVRLSHASPEIKLLCYFIIDALDENGYFTQQFDHLLPSGHPGVADSDWQTALALVQQLSPAGMAARNLTEALHLQVQALGLRDTSLEQALHYFIEHDLARIAKGEMSHLNDYSTEAPHVRYKDLLRMVRRLNPKPGLHFASTQPAIRIPDVYLVRHQGQWLIAPNPNSMPEVTVPTEYIQYLASHKHQALQAKLKEAQQLSTALAMRKATICRVATRLVEHQALFFEVGEQALQALTIRQLAQDLGLHESTVSRATMNKYISTPMGIYSFRFFFSGELETSFGGRCSSATAKSLIRDLIKAEPSDAPLSDVDIHQHLRQQSITISKRTVTKYRLQMRIPNAKERSRHALLKDLH
ncbi:RNA polymerase factor sigma-54 [Alcaligenes endophyticus]|uniref:RNA polymerase sigma-54 factor n=1 Tax=Alcaligenes endophyticus TaxID=1929088 RepID=A0ABT8EMA5_9BURK|nr:RNA polymerase factor sigma-54 [Alcaligenes endophyticus]MCX5591005.1 RNA polymerase factor sigma-54 [Alcaligenes endophyticus]MDN4122418.1 RNA polymerase factor sigma-54 [Alcaligenes endophyticus]